MKPFALVTDNINPTLSESDALLVPAFKQCGYEARAVPWDKPKVEWSTYKGVILRSCWNYHKDPKKFINWLTALSEMNVPIANPIPVIHWNMHKSYLLDLSRKGLPVIPTKVITKGSRERLSDIRHKTGWSDLVIKPAVGAGAYNVFRSGISSRFIDQIRFVKLVESCDCIVQPLIGEILTDGEWSFVFIGNIFSHAVQKKPKAGDFRANIQYGATEYRTTPKKSLVKQAQKILSIVGKRLLYARVDCVIKNSTLLLMELELIEPHLFFDMYPESAERFARTATRFIG